MTVSKAGSYVRKTTGNGIKARSGACHRVNRRLVTFSSFGREAVRQRLQFGMIADVPPEKLSTTQERLKRATFDDGGHLERTWNNEAVTIDHLEIPDIQA